METTTTPAGTITRYSYDVLGRRTSRKVGTVDGGASDNMTLVEEWFYDDEEDTSSNVGDGFLTRHTAHTGDSGQERVTDYDYDYKGNQEDIDGPGDVLVSKVYDNLNRVTETLRYDTSSGSTLVAKNTSSYDSWGQEYESRIYGVDSGTGSDYATTESWRDARGLVIKTLSQGKVFQKTEYDGAGRAVRRSVSYDTDESAYGEADDLAGDTVVEELELVVDARSSPILTQHYKRHHDAASTHWKHCRNVTSQGRSSRRPWFDQLHRQSVTVNYGTNGGTNLTSRTIWKSAIKF